MQSLLLWTSLFLVILSHFPFLNGAPSLSQCPDNYLNITGGKYILSNSYNAGSILRYICPEGFYPYPQKKRECHRGQWDPKPSTKPVQVCKKVTCPNPNVLVNGVVIPVKSLYYVNDTTTYRCNSDYTFRGSETRVCQVNGKWSGGTPICSHNTDHCPDPGTPPGASRQGHIFNIDDKVTYTCSKNLKLIGSKVRVCQDGGQWSGKEPECYADFAYDTPEEVAEAFGNSMKTTLSLNEESGQVGKKIRLDKGGKLDIYIALDASDSIEEEDFNKAKKVIKKLITKISYYEVSPNYEVIIFATDVTKIVNVNDFKRGKVKLADILKILDDYNYDDLYAFGVGEDTDKEKIDEWVTKRDGEEHFFVLKSMDDVARTLDKMIDESTSVSLCGLYKDYFDIGFKSTLRETYPWMIKISITHLGGTANCIGSLVTPSFILTAAHCFRFDDKPEKILLVAPNAAEVKLPEVKLFILHPDYNITAKTAKGISEYYEYDVALIQLKKGVEITSKLRTICIPCTVETNRALQLSSNDESCDKHREFLLDSDLVKAYFMSHKVETLDDPKKNIQIRQNKQRDECLQHAQDVLQISKENAKERITNNFLCSGGASQNYIDDVTCKGDSGGPAFVERNRLIQVGVISWGLKDTCAFGGNEQDTRDFHIDLFSPQVQDFLQKYLGDGDIDTPLTFV
ncbi:complement factor B-like isoform X2 [Neoarius graeffei]|uniref:complement factor B-like isoform X2 n=1 Tax=Neoarius graeffei TaxID=443677 RepID=UPI00298C68E0|nr:complement factor B-like isoform X2 [Neoarius graeffei]